MGYPTITSIDSTGTAYQTKVGSDAPRKHVTRSEVGADYKLSWGDQHFDGAHMVVQCDKPYGIALDEFQATHIGVGDGLYVKSANILAVQLTEKTEVITMAAGKEESRSLAPAGVWVVRNPGGEIYTVPDGEFQSKYDLDVQ